MKKHTKIILSLMLAGSMCLPLTALADEEVTEVVEVEEISEIVEETEEVVFPDMPDNWTTEALKRAVKNGLLNGSDGKILPDDNITRAQMAAIIVRAFGVNKEADISAFPDVSESKWYYSEFAKAVYMKAFGGTDDGKLNPDNFITFSECFTVVTRVFDLGESDEKCLDAFSDADEIKEWAKPYLSSVVGNGYWNGVEGELKPNDYITRSEFAVLMDNLIKTYITEPGVYKELEDGNILIKSADVVIEKLESDDIIIIGDGVEGDVKLIDIVSTGEIIGRGGNIAVTGTVHDVSACTLDTFIDLSNIENRTGHAKGTAGATKPLIQLGVIELMP
ncbi:MAG: S-layer homology domain-containing protein [Clostridia bacterium]|nr:S-layer homology domain-containing protein [Clostridia bacterium]